MNEMNEVNETKKRNNLEFLNTVLNYLEEIEHKAHPEREQKGYAEIRACLKDVDTAARLIGFIVVAMGSSQDTFAEILDSAMRVIQSPVSGAIQKRFREGR